MEFPQNIAPIPPDIDPKLAQYLYGVLQSMQLQIYKLREFLEPAIHNVQNTPDANLDDWQ